MRRGVVFFGRASHGPGAPESPASVGDTGGAGRFIHGPGKFPAWHEERPPLVRLSGGRG